MTTTTNRHQIDINAYMRVAAGAATVEETLTYIERDFTSVSWAISECPGSAPEVLAAAVAHPDAKGLLLYDLATHPNLPEELIVPTLERSVPQAWAYTLKHSRATPRMFAIALAGNPSHVIPEILEIPTCPLAIVDTYAASADSKVRRLVAIRSQSPDVLAALARDTSYLVRAQAAGNHYLPDDAAKILATDSAITVLHNLLHNPHVPATSKSQAKKSAGFAYKRAQSRGHETVHDVVSHLITSEFDEDVYEGYRSDKRATVRVSATLLALESELITFDEGIAALRSEKSFKTARDQMYILTPALALKIALELDIAIIASRHLGQMWTSDPDIAGLAIESGRPELMAQILPHCPLNPDVLEQMAAMKPTRCVGIFGSPKKYSNTFIVGSGVSWFRPAVIAAMHPDTPADAREVLSQSSDIYVRVALVARMKPAQMRKSLKAAHQVRAAIAARPNAPADVLEVFANDAVVAVRVAVASNRKTPPETLESMSMDSDPAVVAAIAHNPSAPAEVRAIATLMS